MTGSTPYYGGRLTPTQAYGAEHGGARPAPPPAPVAESPTPEERLASLQQLLDDGIITSDEYSDLAARVAP